MNHGIEPLKKTRKKRIQVSQDNIQLRDESINVKLMSLEQRN